MHININLVLLLLHIIGVIPKASTVDRIRDNCNIFDFELSLEDMKVLESCFPSPHHFCWDPTDVV